MLHASCHTIEVLTNYARFKAGKGPHRIYAGIGMAMQSTNENRFEKPLSLVPFKNKWHHICVIISVLGKIISEA